MIDTSTSQKATAPPIQMTGQLRVECPRSARTARTASAGAASGRRCAASAASHGWSWRERLQAGSLRACLPALSGSPEPIHSGTIHIGGEQHEAARHQHTVLGLLEPHEDGVAARKGQNSGRLSATRKPRKNAWPRWPSRWRSIAHSSRPAASGSVKPCAIAAPSEA